MAIIRNKESEITDFEGCQLRCIPIIPDGFIIDENLPFNIFLRRKFAILWNYYIKKQIKKVYRMILNSNRKRNKINSRHVVSNKTSKFSVGDWVRVRSVEEIQATLNPFKELKGCAFLPNMKEYCGSTQRVFQIMERFLDERDYKVKKTSGIVILEGVICKGTPVFGRCDRACHLFWREEWLELIPTADN